MKLTAILWMGITFYLNFLYFGFGAESYLPDPAWVTGSPLAKLKNPKTNCLVRVITKKFSGEINDKTFEAIVSNPENCKKRAHLYETNYDPTKIKGKKVWFYFIESSNAQKNKAE